MAQLTSAGRRPLWIALLVVASAVFSLGFACAVPLAAFAAIAALTLSRRDAFALIGAIWLANQIAGFAVHHYPVTASTLAWGAGLGAAALLSMLAAQCVKDHLAQRHMVAAIAAFLAAFTAYEGSLFAISLALASGVSDYAPLIVGRIFAINTAAFAALFLVHRFVVLAGLAKEPRLPRANGALNTRPPGSRFSKSFRGVFRFVLRRALPWRAPATQVPQILPANPAKPENSIEKRNNNSQKYNIVEHYNNSM